MELNTNVEVLKRAANIACEKTGINESQISEWSQAYVTTSETPPVWFQPSQKHNVFGGFPSGVPMERYTSRLDPVVEAALKLTMAYSRTLQQNDSNPALSQWLFPDHFKEVLRIFTNIK